jgi:hypothetical protein
LEIIELVSTIVGIVTGMIVVSLLYCVGRDGSERVQDARIASAKLKNLVGFSVDVAP